MAQDTPTTVQTIPIPTTEPELPLIPLDESALNPEYDPTKDQRAAFLKTPINPTGPTISPAPPRSVGQVIKEAVTENIPQFSSRTSANPNYGKQSFLPDSDIMTAQQRREAPALAGALDVASELASPATIGTVAATAGVGEAGVIPKVLSGLFAGQIATSVYDQYPALKDAVNRAQTAKTKEAHDDAFADAQRILTHMGADTVMGLLAAKHGADGAKEILDTTTGSGVPDQASTFKNPSVEPAAEPEETHPEMNRDTVKKLQDLGYSNQHITNFNIGEIRDILKNQTPAVEHPVSRATEAKTPAPEPDKFAESGGKLVGPNAPAVVEKPSSTVEKTPETADPIEDLIMSDKIGGKKVRGATPKPVEEAITVPKDKQGSDSQALQKGGWFLPDGQTYVHTARNETHGYSALAMGFPGEAPYTTGGDPITARVEAMNHGAIRATLDTPGNATVLELGNITDKNKSRLLDVLAVAPPDRPVHIASGPLGLTQRHPKEFNNPEEAVDWVDRQTSQSGPLPEAFAEHGGKFVGEAPKAPAPSTGYSVPTEKLQKMPASAGRPEVHTIRHELGHALVGQKEGLTQNGVISDSHPLASSDMRAAVEWSPVGIIDPNTQRIYPDMRVPYVRALMGGIAADEAFNDLPRSANNNFFLTKGGDGTRAYKILRAAGFDHEGALDEMHKAIDDGKEYLTHPTVSGIIKENENTREMRLSPQYHYSHDRLQNMHTELQRRIANEKQNTEINDNGTVSGSTAEGRSGDVTRGKGEISRTGEGQPQEGQITDAEKETNEPNLRNRATVEQNGETTAARDSGESEAATTKPTETEEGIISEEKRREVESRPKSWKSLSDEYHIFHAPRGAVDAHHIESGGGWWLKGDGSWIGSLKTPEGFTQEHQSILQNQLGHDLRAVRIAAPNTFDLGNERPSDAQLQELNRIFKNSGETDVVWHTLRGDGEGSYGDFLRDVQKHYPEDSDEPKTETAPKPKIKHLDTKPKA